MSITIRTITHIASVVYDLELNLINFEHQSFTHDLKQTCFYPLLKEIHNKTFFFMKPSFPTPICTVVMLAEHLQINKGCPIMV